jgi:hypothetical protein
MTSMTDRALSMRYAAKSRQENAAPGEPGKSLPRREGLAVFLFDRQIKVFRIFRTAPCPMA